MLDYGLTAYPAPMKAAAAFLLASACDGIADGISAAVVQVCCLLGPHACPYLCLSPHITSPDPLCFIACRHCCRCSTAILADNILLSTAEHRRCFATARPTCAPAAGHF